MAPVRDGARRNLQMCLGCRIAHGFRRCRGFGGSKLIFFLEAWSKTAVGVRPNSHAISGVGVSSFASFLSNLSSLDVQCLPSRFGGFCRDIATSIFHEVAWSTESERCSLRFVRPSPSGDDKFSGINAGGQTASQIALDVTRYTFDLLGLRRLMGRAVGANRRDPLAAGLKKSSRLY